MTPETSLENKIFQIGSEEEFNARALEIFHIQYTNNLVYREFVDLLGKKPESVTEINEIPFLPIELFKTHRVIAGNSLNHDLLFRSSGTTGSSTSQHMVRKKEIYETSFSKTFELFYGPAKNYRILALLPSYLERSDSSLVYMVNQLIEASNNSESGFFLDNLDELTDLLKHPAGSSRTLLIGVSFALLDLIERENFNLKNTIVMETGGMKGRRRELTRKELHSILKDGFGVDSIHSEYGMTELLSQAYSKGDGHFSTPPWMRLMVRDINDPLSPAMSGKTGGLNIIDLANLYSCSFIATSDLGRIGKDENAEILGRFDFSDLRGCNLMVN